jgi:hypothetical protein
MLRIERQEMDLAERRGELISLTSIRAVWSSKLIAASALQSIPDGFAAVLAAETRPDVVHRILSNEIRHIMAQLSVNPGPRPS